MTDGDSEVGEETGGGENRGLLVKMSNDQLLNLPMEWELKEKNVWGEFSERELLRLRLCEAGEQQRTDKVADTSILDDRSRGYPWLGQGT